MSTEIIAPVGDFLLFGFVVVTVSGGVVAAATVFTAFIRTMMDL